MHTAAIRFALKTNRNRCPAGAGVTVEGRVAALRHVVATLRSDAREAAFNAGDFEACVALLRKAQSWLDLESARLPARPPTHLPIDR